MSDLLMVMEEIHGAHPRHKKYPLIPGDVLTLDADGTYMKHTGLAIYGFRLTPEQVDALKPVDGQIVMCGWDDLEISPATASSTTGPS